MLTNKELSGISKTMPSLHKSYTNNSSVKGNLPSDNLLNTINLPRRGINRLERFFIAEKICGVLGCDKKIYALGYCHSHWSRLLWYPKNKERLHQYQKEYRLKKYGIGLKEHKCKIKNCNKTIFSKSVYCVGHKYRLEKNLPLDLSINCRKLALHSPKGNKNGNWHGGIAEYPNHYLMKKNRLIILLQNPKCEYCDKPAVEVHHRNGDKSDHRLSNLAPSCHKCNSGIRFKPNNTEFYKKYQISSYEMAKKLNVSYTQIYYWNKKQILDSIIASNPFYMR